jgi:hypothetical protein
MKEEKFSENGTSLVLRRRKTVGELLNGSVKRANFNFSLERLRLILSNELNRVDAFLRFTYEEKVIQFPKYCALFRIPHEGHCPEIQYYQFNTSSSKRYEE